MQNNLFLGVALTLLSTLFYSTMNALIKAKAGVLPPLPFVVFLQSFVSLCCTFLLITFSPHVSFKKLLESKRIGLQFLRACTSLTILFSLYYAMAYIPLVNAMLLANSAPLIVPFIGYAFFAEKINHKLWFPVLLGYAGVAIILNPDHNFFEVGALLAFLSAIALAVTIHIVRKLTTTESTLGIMFYFSLFSTLLSGAIALPYFHDLSFIQYGLIILLGILYFASQYTGNACMRYGNPQLISALMYTNVLYSAIFSVIFWDLVPGFSTMIGMVMVVIGGVGCIWVEHVALKRANAVRL